MATCHYRNSRTSAQVLQRSCACCSACQLRHLEPWLPCCCPAQRRTPPHPSLLDPPASAQTFLTGFVVTVAIFLSARAFGFQAYVQRGAGKHCTHPSAGVPAAAMGGALIGAGMMISGACPGTVWAQLGSGEWTALITMGGGIVGVYLFALLHPYLESLMAFGKLGKDKFKIYHMLNTTPYLTGGVFIAACAGLVLALLLTVYEPIADTGKGADARYWNPVLGGLFIGATQIPLLYAGRALGSSTSFVVMASHLAYPVKSSKYLNGQRGSFGSVWSLPFVVAAAAGSALATALSENDSWDTAHVSSIAWYEQFLGGVVLLFGARLASGCTSGHGITGMGTQSLISMAATGAMFLGGIVVAAIYRAAA